MAERDGASAGLKARLATALAGLLSFRVAVAFTTSVSVTAAVAGPLALQAMRVRDQRPEIAATPAPTTTIAPRAPAATSPTDPTTTAAAPPPTTTTQPGATPVVAAGRVERTTTTRPPGTTTTSPVVTALGLAAGVRDDRTDGVELDGARLAGEVFVFVTVPDIRTVRWWVDQSGPVGAPTRTTSVAPFDLGTPFFDTTTLSTGRHRVYVELVTATATLQRAATFDVVR